MDKTTKQQELDSAIATIANLKADDVIAVSSLREKIHAITRDADYLHASWALRLSLCEEEVAMERWLALPACECAVCGMVYEHHCGSTPCCGSVAYVKDTKEIPVWVSLPEKEAAHE